MFNKILEILMNVPVVNLVPLILTALADLPKRYEALPDEKKQAFFEAAVAAATKAMASYAGKNASF